MRGQSSTLTAVDNNGNAVYCNWYDYNSNTLLASNSTTYNFTVPSSAAYGVYTVKAVYVDDISIVAVKPYAVYPVEYRITPTTASIKTGESVTFRTFDGYGSSVRSWWYLDGNLLNVPDNDTQCTITFPDAGTYTVTAECYYNYSLTSVASVTVTVGDDTESDITPNGDYVTNDQMNASQTSQTSTIVNSIKNESSIIQSAIKALETTLSNSNIYQLFTQSFTYYDFDFATGKLSTNGVTLNGFVPTFNYWAQNVEKYLGMLVDVRASEIEEEVKAESSGFWEILLGFFKPMDNGDKATANTDDMNTILGIGDDVQGYFDAGGNIGDIDSIIKSDDTWAWFGADVAADIDSVPVTYSRSAPVIVDYYSKVYSDFYSNVLGREWSGN